MRLKSAIIILFLFLFSSTIFAQASATIRLTNEVWSRASKLWRFVHKRQREKRWKILFKIALSFINASPTQMAAPLHSLIRNSQQESAMRSTTSKRSKRQSPWSTPIPWSVIAMRAANASKSIFAMGTIDLAPATALRLQNRERGRHRSM